MVSHFLKYKGLSLVEISIVLMIICIFLMIIMPLSWQSISNSKKIKHQNDLNTIAQACQKYYQQQGHWPEQVSDLQPIFLSSQFIPQGVVLTAQINMLKVSNSANSLTVVKPRGLLARLDL